MCVQPMIQSPVRVRQKAVSRKDAKVGKDAKKSLEIANLRCTQCKSASVIICVFAIFASLRESASATAKDKMAETYFITGAQGCIGSWIVKALAERGDTTGGL